MIETIGHIKNPLTVIAIFAGLAEVSGTVVLPFLQADTQKVYMWFLMAFPCLLVILFFVTLLQKHHVLYAPSDFRSDESFTGIFTTVSGARGVFKLEEEVKELEADEGSDAHLSNSMKMQIFSKRNIRATAYLAEELVIAALGKELGVRFERNVALLSNQSLLFDGVVQSPHRTLIVEVKYTRTGKLRGEQIRSSFGRIIQAYEMLPNARKSAFQVIFAIVVEGSNVRKGEIQKDVAEEARSYPFQTEVRIFDLDTLENNLEREVGALSQNTIPNLSTRIIGLLGAGKSLDQHEILRSLAVDSDQALSDVQHAIGQLVLAGTIEHDPGSAQNYRLTSSR